MSTNSKPFNTGYPPSIEKRRPAGTGWLDRTWLFLVSRLLNRFGACLTLLLTVLLPALGRTKPHYTFILPDGYVGWVQVVFNDPQVSPLPVQKDEGRVLLPFHSYQRVGPISRCTFRECAPWHRSRWIRCRRHWGKRTRVFVVRIHRPAGNQSANSFGRHY
jgi:hypothetical protein